MVHERRGRLSEAAAGDCGISVSEAPTKCEKTLHGICATVLAIITAMVVYVVVLLLIKGIKKEDILQMPKGNKIIKVLEKFKLIR